VISESRRHGEVGGLNPLEGAWKNTATPGALGSTPAPRVRSAQGTYKTSGRSI
jgi:hypothetical protein